MLQDTNGLTRRLRMLAIFARYAGDRLLGRRYPPTIDAITAHLTTFEKQTLFRLARGLPDGAQIVEIGSFKGGSACCFGAAIQGTNARLHCVDTFRSDAMSDTERQDTYDMFMANTKPYADRITVHRGLSTAVVGDFDPPIDLLFVDGDHSWEGVTADLAHYVPLMRDGGILVMHDVGYNADCQRALKTIVFPIEQQRLALLPNLYAGQIRPGDAAFPS